MQQQQQPQTTTTYYPPSQGSHQQQGSRQGSVMAVQQPMQQQLPVTVAPVQVQQQQPQLVQVTQPNLASSVQAAREEAMRMEGQPPMQQMPPQEQMQAPPMPPMQNPPPQCVVFPNDPKLLYSPANATYVAPGQTLRGGMTPVYAINEVRTFEAMPVFSQQSMAGQHEQPEKVDNRGVEMDAQSHHSSAAGSVQASTKPLTQPQKRRMMCC